MTSATASGSLRGLEITPCISKEGNLRMTLSDTCYKTLANLSSTVLLYSEQEHYTGYLSGVFDAMFALADVALRMRTFDPLYPQYAELGIAKLMFTTLVPDNFGDDRYPRWHITMVLVDIASSNKQFARALLLLEEWLTTIDGHYCMTNECTKFSLVADVLEDARWSTAGLAA